MDTCGAKTRAGTPCQQKSIYWNGRCKFHGGLATGPTTDAGKEQARINGRKGGRPRKDGAGKTQVTETLQNTAIPDAQVSARVSSEMSILAHVPDAANQSESSPEKPKSWTLKEVKVLTVCDRCTMFAGSGACLAVAKGIIPSVPTDGDCPGFVDFETA